jgi:hypothetical protein
VPSRDGVKGGSFGKRGCRGYRRSVCSPSSLCCCDFDMVGSKFIQKVVDPPAKSSLIHWLRALAFQLHPCNPNSGVIADKPFSCTVHSKVSFAACSAPLD